MRFLFVRFPVRAMAFFVFCCYALCEKGNYRNAGEAVDVTNIEIVYRFFKEGYENKNYDAVMSCVATDYVDHSPAGARAMHRRWRY